jgi:hypothetical protein
MTRTIKHIRYEYSKYFWDDTLYEVVRLKTQFKLLWFWITVKTEKV